MPAHLMGLLAIGTFYLITVVVGMCATRCLTDDDGEEDDERNKSADDTGEDTLHLLRLLEQSLPDMVGQRNANRRLNTTPHPVQRHRSGDQYDESGSPLDLLSSHTTATMASHHQQQQSEQYLPTGNGTRAPKMTTKSRSSDADRMILDTTVSPNDMPYMSVSRSVPMELGSQHTLMSHMPPIVSGRQRAPFSPSSCSIDSSRPPPLPTGGRYLLADRNIGWIIGTCSMLAIKTGGIFPAAIAEQTFAQGLLWCQLPFASALSVVVGGTLFARAMYSEGFVTIMDPFQHVYGNMMSCALVIPLLVADILYSCVIISSLSHLQHLALDVDPAIGVLTSTTALLCYMLIGGFYAGTFTDSLQYIYLLLGLLILTPSLLFSDLVTKPLFDAEYKFLGEVNGRNSGLYIDQFVMLILGGVPMQSYFQRMFSCRTSTVSTRVTIFASLGTMLTGIPTIFIGLAAHSIEWNGTALGQPYDMRNLTDANLALPYAISYAVPSGIKMMSLGALTSGLLASCDSSIFGLSTIMAHNFYRGLWNPTASSKRITWFTRLFTLLVTLLILTMCLAWPNWYKFWMIPFDILYVFVFPQLFCVVYFKYANSYGAVCGLWTSIMVRYSFGEKTLSLPAFLQLPFYTPQDGQLFPYRTLAMLANLITIIVTSAIVEQMVSLGLLSSSQNFCQRRRRSPSRQHQMSLERRLHSPQPRSLDAGETCGTHHRRRVNRYVPTSSDAKTTTRSPPSPRAADSTTITSLYRHADSRGDSPLIEKMTVL